MVTMYVMIHDDGVESIESLADIPTKYDGAFAMERHGGVIFCKTTKPCMRTIENYRSLLGWIWVERS